MTMLIDTPRIEQAAGLARLPLSVARERLAQQIAAALAQPTPGWRRLAQPVAPLDLLNWWRKQPGPRKLYWSDRADRVAVAAVGSALLLAHSADQPLTAAYRAPLFGQMHSVLAAASTSASAPAQTSPSSSPSASAPASAPARPGIMVAA